MQHSPPSPLSEAPPERWLGAAAAARIVEVTTTHLYRLAEAEKVRTKKIAGRLLFERTSLEKYRASRAA